jgi:hemerythrin superfamily protein
MKKGETITQFMIEEHGKILTLLNSFKNEKNSVKINEKFNAFNKKQENHAFAEEKAIIILTKENKQYEEIAIILKQHDSLRDLTKKIQESLGLKNLYNSTLEELRELMKDT